MVTYHPVTLEMLTAKDQFTDILSVIDSHKEISVIFTKANADTDGRFHLLNFHNESPILHTPYRAACPQC